MSCASREELEKLLNAGPDDPSQESLYAHLEKCQQCQEALELLVANAAPSSWRLLLPLQTSNDEPDVNFVKQLKQAIPEHGGWGLRHGPSRPNISGGEQSKPGRGARLPHIPNYELLSELGRGGMGVVYRARQLGLNRLVALKMILPGSPTPEDDWARFRTEAEAVARLQHPNIIQIYEVGEYDGHPYFSMELADSGNLAQQLGGIPQPVRPAAEFIETLARAIHYAHERGIIHRDLKPANVLLEKNEGGRMKDEKNADGSSLILHPSSFRPKITDFGLAKRLDDVQQTRRGVVVCTLSYMAPEQASCWAPSVGPAVDVYALGAVLYELLTGRPPFRGASWSDTLAQLERDEPAPPCRLQPRVPRDLDTVCLKCLEKNPARRYASAWDLAEDLRRFLEGRPITARPIRAWERAAKWACRRPAVAALSAAIIAVTVVAVGMVTWQWRLAVANALAEAQARRDVERLLAGAIIDRGVVLCEGSNIATGMLWLARGLEMAVRLEDSDLERVARVNLTGWRNCLFRNRAVLPHSDWAWDVAYSPNGRAVLTGGRDRIAQLWDAVTGLPLCPPLKHEHPVWSLAFSSDSRTVLTGSGADNGKQGQFRLWDATTGQPLGPPQAMAGRVSIAAFRPGSAGFLTLADGKVQLWELGNRANPQDRAARSILLAHPGTILVARFSPDGKTVLTGGADGTARTWDAATGKFAGHLLVHAPAAGSAPGREMQIRAAAFSPDGQFILTGTQLVDREAKRLVGGEARLWRTDTGEPIGDTLSHGGPVLAVAFSSDSRLALTGSRVLPSDVSEIGRGEARLYDTATGCLICPPLDHRMPVWSVAFSPNGRLLATGCEDRFARFWMTATGQVVGPAVKHEGNVRALAFSPDGRTILTGSASSDGKARLWEVPSGLADPLPLLHDAEIRNLAVSPDGLTVVTADRTNRLAMWDTVQRKHRGATQMSAAPDSVRFPLAFGLDGRIVATGDRNGQVWLFDVSTGHTRIPPTPPQAGRVVGLAFSPDGGSLLATFSGDDVWLQCFRVNAEEATGLALRPRDSFLAAKYSPDGRRILAASPQGIAVWDAATGAFEVQRPMPERRFEAMLFSPDGARLATGGDQLAQLWEVATATSLGPPLPHLGSVVALAFSSDGRTLATGSHDGTARLWDVAAAKSLGPPLPHRDAVTNVALTPDGRRVLTVSRDKAVRFWEVPGPWRGEPALVRLELAVLTGLELEANGVVLTLTQEAWRQRHERLEQLGGRQLP